MNELFESFGIPTASFSFENQVGRRSLNIAIHLKVMKKKIMKEKSVEKWSILDFSFVFSRFLLYLWFK